MVCCCVPQCPSNSRKKSQFKLSFHEFPCNQETRNQWTKFVASLCPESQTWQPHEGGRTSVCSRHFRDEDFVAGAKFRVLKRGAVPSIFEMVPIYTATLSDDLASNGEVIVVSTSPGSPEPTDNASDVVRHPADPTAVSSNKTVLYDYLRTSLPELFASAGELDDICAASGSGMVSGTDLDGPYDPTAVPGNSTTGLQDHIITISDNPARLPGRRTQADPPLPLLPDPTFRKVSARQKRTVQQSTEPASGKCQRISVKDRKKFYHTPLEAIRILRQRIASKRAQICRLRRTVHSLEEEVGRNGAGRVRNDENRDAQRLRTAAEAGDPSAVFLLDMVRARQMKHVRCSELTVRYCKLLRTRFAPAYEFIRKSGLLRLPSRQTLGRYVGEGGGGVGARMGAGPAPGERNGELEQPLVEQEVLLDDLCQPSEIVLEDDCLM